MNAIWKITLIFLFTQILLNARDNSFNPTNSYKEKKALILEELELDKKEKIIKNKDINTTVEVPKLIRTKQTDKKIVIDFNKNKDIGNKNITQIILGDNISKDILRVTIQTKSQLKDYNIKHINHKLFIDNLD
jgi:hypothetical protein